MKFYLNETQAVKLSKKTYNSRINFEKLRIQIKFDNSAFKAVLRKATTSLLKRKLKLLKLLFLYLRHFACYDPKICMC
jgi:hypothetical protein